MMTHITFSYEELTKWWLAVMKEKNCEKGFMGEGMVGGKGDTTVNKAVGQNRIQLLPRCWAEHSECRLFSGHPVEKRSLLYSG